MKAEHRSDPDQALIQQAVAGDSQALEQLLMVRHDGLAAKLARRLPREVQRVVSPEDILQEVFISVFRHIDQFVPQGDGSFDRWLSRIATRKLINTLRAHRTARRGGGRAALADPGTPSMSVVRLLDLVAVDQHTPSRSVAGHDAVRAMQVAIAGLREDYRQAIQLRHLEGLSVAQTAQRMGRTTGAVEMLCHRGLRQLRAAMGRASRYLSRSQ